MTILKRSDSNLNHFSSSLTRRYSAEIGAVLATVQGTQARYEMIGDEVYVRARITSSALHPNPSEIGEFQRAWCQPVVGAAGRR